MSFKTVIDWRLFAWLLAGGLVGTLAVMPFVFTLQAEALQAVELPLAILVLVSLLQTGVLLGLAIFVGLCLGPKVGLGAPILGAWLAGRPLGIELKPLLLTSALLGVLTGLLIIGFDAVFLLFIEPIEVPAIPMWQGALAGLYGGIVEEILMRLFLVTLLVWLFLKFGKQAGSKIPTPVIWAAIIIVAVIFGLGHLPATAALATLTPLIIVRAVVLNGIGGLVFGWLYWKKGLEAAMLAHFATDMMLQVVLPLSVKWL